MTSDITKEFLRARLQNPLRGARALLGNVLTTTHKGIKTSGMIVEVEAYDGRIDQACHAYGGITERCKVMFGEAGLCYVYFIYGMHYCVNVVTGKQGHGTAVLIRALEPLAGIEEMRRRRKGVPDLQLTNGPAKLCEALSIDKKLSGEDFFTSRKISIAPYKKVSSRNIIATTRIGISKSAELPWRFYIRDNPFVSTR